MTLEFDSMTGASNGSDLHLIGDQDGRSVLFAIDLSVAREALHLDAPYRAALALESWRDALVAACRVSYLRRETGIAAPIRVGRADFSTRSDLCVRDQLPGRAVFPWLFLQSLGPMYARLSAQMDR